MSRLNPYVALSKFYQSTAIVPTVRKFQPGYGRRAGNLIELTINGIGTGFVEIGKLTQKEKELAGFGH